MTSSKLKTIAKQMEALREQAAAVRAQEVNSAMTIDEFNKAIEKLGLTKREAGIFFGASPRQGQRWGLAEAPIPNSVVLAIHLMLKHKHTPDEFYKFLGMPDGPKMPA